jgi:hypothetical protein
MPYESSLLLRVRLLHLRPTEVSGGPVFRNARRASLKSLPSGSGGIIVLTCARFATLSHLLFFLVIGFCGIWFRWSCISQRV